MEAAWALAVLAVIASWAVLAWTLWRWGPGQGHRRIRCPEKRVRARVGVELREGDFGRLLITDITTCSLLPGQLVACSKECLRQL